MNAYSTLDRGAENPQVQADVLASQAKPQILERPGKGLSIADSARRDLQTTLQLLADRAQYITGASGAAIALRDGDRVLCRASSGSAAPELGSYLDLSAGLSGESVRARAPMKCDDAANDPRVDRESCRRLGIASFAVMPILRDGEVVGIFEIFAGKPHTFQERDLAALERLREMVNTALDQTVCGHARPASFAVHGLKVKALAAAAGSGVVPDHSSGAAADKTGFITGLPGTQTRDPGEPMAGDRIRSCAHCGFPVSEGRVLCIDCEGKGIHSSSSEFRGGSSRRSVKSWIVANRYIIGMILISAATIAFALLR